MYETILVERKNRVALLTLNRPEMRNALNSQLPGKERPSALEGTINVHLAITFVPGGQI